MIKKLFGEINMTWKKVIIYAIAAGVYTALMALFVPDRCSFHDIAVTEEAWILLALVIITNCEKPLEAALKTFVFFLVSQPLVYLIQVPFSDMGWGLFGYYRYWFIITLFTFPGAFIAWYVKKDNNLSGIILSAALVLLCIHGAGYIKSALNEFPDHLLSAVYCIGIIPVFIIYILKNKKARILSCIISAAALAVMLVCTFVLNTNYIKRGNVLLDDVGIVQLDENCEVTVSDEKVSKAWIEDDNQGGYQLMMEFYKYDKNTVTVTDAEGNETVFEVYLDDDKNYRVSKG